LRGALPQTDYSPYAPAAPYFDLVRHALGEAVEGEHFFDIIAPDIAYEVLYDFPGWPRLTPGREALMDAFRGYVQHIALAPPATWWCTGSRAGVRAGIRSARHDPCHRARLSQPLLLDRHHGEPQDHALARLHGSLAAWNALTA
jgi:hypothetical protein